MLAGPEALAAKIEYHGSHVWRLRGYDILLFEDTGAERLIEVRTIRYAGDTPLFVMRNEVATSETARQRVSGLPAVCVPPCVVPVYVAGRDRCELQIGCGNVPCACEVMRGVMACGTRPSETRGKHSRPVRNLLDEPAPNQLRAGRPYLVRISFNLTLT